MPYAAGMQKKPTHQPRHLRERPGIARRLNELCDRETVKAVKTLFEWLMILQFIVQMLQSVLDTLSKLV